MDLFTGFMIGMMFQFIIARVCDKFCHDAAFEACYDCSKCTCHCCGYYCSLRRKDKDETVVLHEEEGCGADPDCSD